LEWNGNYSPLFWDPLCLPASRVLESLKAGKRQAEGPYANLKIAAKGQRSVYSMFKKPKDPSPAAAG
jgi:hypothetical protein